MRSKGIMRKSRKNNGATLAGVAAVLSVASVLFLLVAAVCLNGYAFYDYTGKAQVIAEEVAKLVGRRSYFLGAARPQFQAANAGESQKLAQSYAEHLADVLHIPHSAGINIKVLSNELQDSNLSMTKVQVELSNVSLPADIAGVLPKMADIKAVGVASGASEAPPAFVRFGFKLIDPSQSNPSVNDATQVVMLPAYGFQTDSGLNFANLGGTANNNDVAGNQPDPSACLWAGINASPDALRSNAPYVTGPDGKRITAFN